MLHKINSNILSTLSLLAVNKSTAHIVGNKLWTDNLLQQKARPSVESRFNLEMNFKLESISCLN